ncbi:helix-turn-helix transcriptional regulator [uncultured Muribaculum sp.]|uniref:helix-turn-helix domain-containing protein n=1 Tax=uncultured Muribaculum sp. TaxID=1918613 RepID=UPI0025B13817|nr:helix-turn-helix transcriptional regulator [uncultured Muribaculum sp.]
MPVNDVDSEFYSKVLDIMKKEMGNPDLNVDSLASMMGLGRSQFYRKIKALTNYSPVELLRNLRLKQAREMLTTTEKTIGEIAYEVGFSSPAYFTRCYREAFDETPTELRERIAFKK